MALTDLEIANLALVRMGIHKQLTALPDTSSEGKALAVLLPRMKARVLDAHEWSWAQRHAALTAATAAPAELPFGWSLAYDLPADLRKPVRLWDGARRFPADGRIPFQVAPCRAALTVGAVAQSTPTGNTAGTGMFVLTGTPTEGGSFAIVIASASSEPFGGGEAPSYAVVLKDGVFRGALEMTGATPDFPYDATGIGLAGVTIALSGEAATFSTGDSYTFTVSGTEATSAATSYLLTDQDEAELIYVSSGWLATTPTCVSPEAVDDVVAWLLAAELALPLAKRPDLAGVLAKTAAAELRRAINLDRGTVAADPVALPDTILARR